MKKSEKTTGELKNEIKSTGEISKFFENNSGEFNETPLHEYICSIIKSKGLKKADVIKRSGLNRVYGYQILSGKRLPQRDKLIAAAFGLQLDVDDTNKMLKYAGFAELYARSKRDAIIIASINEGRSVFYANDLLFENGFEILTT